MTEEDITLALIEEDEETQLALAKADGWTDLEMYVSRPEFMEDTNPSRFLRGHSPLNPEGLWQQPPDYQHCHYSIRALMLKHVKTKKDRQQFCVILAVIIQRHHQRLKNIGLRGLARNLDSPWAEIMATPAQLCEALLYFIWKWRK